MSLDESTCKNISTCSNRTETTQQLNANKAEEWEINLIGNFVLNLYHRSIITPSTDWCIKKSDARKEYAQLVTKELRQKLRKHNDGDNIGTLLKRCGFLFNTTRGSSFYKIKYKSLFEYRKSKIKELDYMKISSDGVKQETNDKGSDSILLNLDKEKLSVLVEDNFEIDENEAKKRLEYQGTIIQRRENTFCPTNMGCYICQEEFSTMETFEEHIQTHGEDTDFAFLATRDKFKSQFFTMSYRLCKNSHNFCFEFETSFENLIIEKIIIVQSRSFFYVNNMRVPYKCPENGMDRFFVDSHLFTIYVEQPIVMICHLEDNKDLLIIEQHHFMRSEEFPKVHFAINPNRLPNKKLFKPKFQLAEYFPPKEIQDALKDDFYTEKLMKTSNDFRDYILYERELQSQTMGDSLNILLQIEDMDTIQEYLSLKQKNIKLRSYGDEYSFQLQPNQRMFVENILTAYDELILTTRTDMFTKNEEIKQLMLQNKFHIKRMNNTFVGQVQAVNTGRISFKCDQKIDIHGVYTVIFRPSRLNLRYQYRSLQLLPSNMHFLSKFLFPTKIISMPLPTLSLTLYNENINGEQLQAVRNIAQGPRNDATYIIFGPPGTGKTTTLVEGILQILKKPDTKVLATASSNSACDILALKLWKYLKQLDIKRPMVRIYSRSCEVRTENIDDELLENSNMYNGQFYPDVEILHEYRVVICTLSVVAKLSTGKFGRKENGATLYTHLFIDEVAASMETEALLAITTILTPNACLIISGDHKQLGPILQSRRAIELGLDVSLMDRLLKRDCYRVDEVTGDYDRTIQTRLVRNFRSHPAIVNLYSGLYYNNTLEPYAKRDDVSLCEVWHKSRNKQYPILFHAIYEPSISDNRSHSLYNRKELYIVMDYVKDLMYFGINGEPVKESDIGIISPYKRQYKRIQEELNLRKWFDIETGSVETFQGKEKNIIIVSFVRSGTETLGFLDNPRRLNVTLSRPKSYLILIGNPNTLSLNSDFEHVIKKCQLNNTFVGLNAPSREHLKYQSTVNSLNNQEQISNLNQKLQALSVENIHQDKATEISEKNRQRCRSRARKNSRSNNNEKSNDNYNGNHKNKDNIIDDHNEGEENEKDKPIILAPQKAQNDSNTNLDSIKIDTIFDELPKVPKVSTKPTITYTKHQLLQMYNNLQQATNDTSQFSLANNSTGVYNTNLSCFKDVPMSHQRATDISKANVKNNAATTDSTPKARIDNLKSINKDTFREVNVTKDDSFNSAQATKRWPNFAAYLPANSLNTINLSENNKSQSHKSFTVPDAFRHFKDNKNSNMTTNSTAVTSNMTYNTVNTRNSFANEILKVTNENADQKKIIHSSPAENIVSKEKLLNTSGDTTKAYTANRSYDKSEANILHTVLRDALNDTWATNAGSKINSLASSSTSSNPAVRRSISTTIDKPNTNFNITSNSNFPSMLHIRNSNDTSYNYSNISSSNSTQIPPNSLNTFTRNRQIYAEFANEATEAIYKPPIYNLTANTEKKKKKKGCVIS